MNRKTLVVCLLAVAAMAANAYAATEARMRGTITDAATKKPIANALVHFEATERRTIKQDFKADKNGKYELMMLDGTITYNVTFSAPGYQPYVEKIKLKIGGEMTLKDVELQPGDAMPAATAKAAPAVDTNVVAYNEGVQLYKDGKTAEAIAKFKDVVKAKPEMIAAWEALALASLRNKEYAGAIEAANKALEIAPDETDMYEVLYDAYTKTGDKAKAAEAKKKLPADAGSLFNDAVKLLNDHKYAQAEPLLRQVIQANDKFARAYYELGIVCISLGKTADAKTNLQKYIELDPNGKDVADVKDMLKYLQ